MSWVDINKLLTIDTVATFADIQPSENPSFHKAKTRIMAIESIANRCNFSKEAVINGLPTLKNVPIVTYYNEDGNLGDHELSKDTDGKPIFKTYGIGVIPESAEQWIEEVEENGTTKQYLCSDVLLWKRQKREYEFIQRHKELSVSMEVQITDSSFDKNKILNVDSFYFTAVTVLGIGVNPAFDSANLTFSKQNEDQIQEMMFELQNFDGVGNMDGQNNQVTENTTVEPQPQVEPTGVDNTQEPVVEPEAEPAQEPTKDEPDYKALLEEVQSNMDKMEADYGRTIAELTTEKEDLVKQLEQVRTELEGKVTGLQEQLKELEDYKKGIELEALKVAVQGVKEEFTDLLEDEDFKVVVEKLEKGELTPEQATDKGYAIIGRKTKANRKANKQMPAPKLNISATHKDVPVTKDTRYGGLLYR